MVISCTRGVRRGYAPHISWESLNPEYCNVVQLLPIYFWVDILKLNVSRVFYSHF